MDFFNKTISWSLRDYSKANSELVNEFVEKYKEKWTNNFGLMNGLFINHSKPILICKTSSISHVVIAMQRSM